MWRILFAVSLMVVMFSARPAFGQTGFHPAPAAEGEPISNQFKVSVNQAPIAVYLARIANTLPAQRQVLMGPSLLSQTSTASFASFDLAAKASVSVVSSENVTSAKILPESLGIHPTFSGQTVTFDVAKPCQLTLEISGNWVESLHLFANSVEAAPPDPKDPNVIYFAPGIYHIPGMKVGSGKTVYIADGAIIYGEAGGADPGTPVFYLNGSNIVMRGRGIIDGSLCPNHARSLLGVTGSNIQVEGITLRDSSTWTMPVRRADHVTIHNVKIFGWRGNSDGIDICNSQNVDVQSCFVRTFDDLIVLKTDKGQGILKDVSVSKCVLWNEFAHALSLGAELRESLSEVRFSDCDIIHDKGREWLLRVYNCDSAPVTDVAFDNIRIVEARRLMSLWIGKAYWSKEAERGHIEKITFQNITTVKPQSSDPFVDLTGFDSTHEVVNSQFRNVVIGGAPLELSNIRHNAFVHGVVITPQK